jgi:hypothetical protein
VIGGLSLAFIIGSSLSIPIGMTPSPTPLVVLQRNFCEKNWLMSML